MSKKNKTISLSDAAFKRAKQIEASGEPISHWIENRLLKSARNNELDGVCVCCGTNVPKLHAMATQGERMRELMAEARFNSGFTKQFLWLDMENYEIKWIPEF